jgi:glyoxylase-like metal-dependent hydrolase (beta-lactamase superfamily II)
MERFTRISENLFRFTDSCNAYLVKDGDVGLLIDAGSGACLDHLDEVGVGRIEWVLHTHHHRDQCWGTPRLRESGANVAVPEYERHLFDQADLFWQTRRTYDNYDDRNTFFTVGEPIEVDAVLEDYDEFAWRGYRFFVLPAKGHTYGSSTLLVEIDGQSVAFTGDLMGDGGVLYQLHAMEYMYSGLEGLSFTLQSIQALRRREPALALPSHGEPIGDVSGDIHRLERRITDCVRLGRGMHVGGIWSLPESNFLPELELIPLSRHLLWGGIWTCSNFYILLSDSGKALFVDYGTSNLAHLHIHADHEGLESMRFVEHRLDALREDYGVTEIEVVIPTHIHDDHTCGIPYLQRFHGTECWALDQVAQVIENPADWASTPCVYPKPIRVDRTLTDGESFSWEEYDFEIFHAPGQTEFHSVIATDIDGKRVAFTGDNWQADEVTYEGRSKVSAFQTTVMRNSFQLGMHQKCAEVMRRVNPELICPGHNDVLDCTKGDLDSYCDFIEQKDRAFRRLVAEPADHYIDLFWARLLPYLTTAQPSETVSFRIMLRNNLERSATYAARLLPAHGWTSEDKWGEARLEPGERGEIELCATAPPEGDGARRLLTAEIAIDGETQGPISEALVTVTRAGLA